MCHCHAHVYGLTRVARANPCPLGNITKRTASNQKRQLYGVSNMHDIAPPHSFAETTSERRAPVRRTVNKQRLDICNAQCTTTGDHGAMSTHGAVHRCPSGSTRGRKLHVMVDKITLKTHKVNAPDTPCSFVFQMVTCAGTSTHKTTRTPQC